MGAKFYVCRSYREKTGRVKVWPIIAIAKTIKLMQINYHALEHMMYEHDEVYIMYPSTWVATKPLWYIDIDIDIDR